MMLSILPMASVSDSSRSVSSLVVLLTFFTFTLFLPTPVLVSLLEPGQMGAPIKWPLCLHAWHSYSGHLIPRQGRAGPDHAWSKFDTWMLPFAVTAAWSTSPLASSSCPRTCQLSLPPAAPSACFLIILAPRHSVLVGQIVGQDPFPQLLI